MEELYKKSRLYQRSVDNSLKRSIYEKIDWGNRLIGILGARGTEKTTIMLQRMREVNEKTIYFSLDDLYFSDNKLFDVLDEFQQNGGQVAFVDEVHKYPDWSAEIKTAHDLFKDLKIVYSGSSIIDIYRQDGDLSRRAVQYKSYGLSFREYLHFKGVGNYSQVSLNQILTGHEELAYELIKDFKPIEQVKNYLQKGYYPFFMESESTYLIKINQVINAIIDSDLAIEKGVDAQHRKKMKQLLYILATNVPFKPNISKLASKTGLYRSTLVKYINYLEQAGIINTITKVGKSISTLQKPDKVFLENPNLHFALDIESANWGTVRESFILNQLKNTGHEVSQPPKGDFIVNDKIVIEVGGSNKTGKQIKQIPNSYIAADDMEIGVGNKIPLWLFGFLY